MNRTFQIISMELGSSLIRARFARHTQGVETYGERRCRFKNDLESDYPFPRIAAMQGDGKTSYDVGKDGIPTQIGECAVRTDIFGTLLRFPTKNTGRLPPRQGSDKTQNYLCQGHGIGCTSTHTFFFQVLTFNTHPGEAPMERLCVFHKVLI